MSEWHEPKEDDIDIEKDRKEVHIFVKQDDNWGSIWVSLTFDQIREIAEKMEANN